MKGLLQPDIRSYATVKSFLGDTLDLEEGGFSGPAIRAQASLLFERANCVAGKWKPGKFRADSYHTCLVHSAPRYTTAPSGCVPGRIPRFGSTHGQISKLLDSFRTIPRSYSQWYSRSSHHPQSCLRRDDPVAQKLCISQCKL